MTRMTTTSRQRRARRGAAASGVAVLTAATAHTLAGDGAPPWWLVLAIFLLSLPVAVLLVGSRLSRRGTIAAVLAAQAFLHLAFAAVGTGTPHLAVHEHGAALPALLTGSHLHLTAPMIAAHLIAAAVTAAALWHGERMLHALGRGIRRLFATARPVLSFHPRPLRPVRSFALIPTRAPFVTVLSRRGPPALAA